VDISLSAYTVEGGFDRDRLSHAFIALFFPSQGVEGVGQDSFLQGLPYTTVRALVSRATRYRV